jgi:hypothetical protein
VPALVNQVTFAATALLGVIFLLQAIAAAVGSDPLHDLAYDVLGQWLEGLLTLTFIAWCFVMLLCDSQGKTHLLGLAVVPLLLVYATVSFVTKFFGDGPPDVFKLLFLPAMVWLLLESRKPATKIVPART